MTSFILVKYLHLLSAFGMAGCLMAELVLLKPTLTRSEIKRIGKIDGFYGLSAITLVAAGFTMWFVVGKGPGFYEDTALYIKLTLAILIGLISIFPTVFFIRSGRKKDVTEIQIPAYIKRLVIIQLILLACIPPLATMVAYGLKF
jgi:putative membrane protein